LDHHTSVMSAPVPTPVGRQLRSQDLRDILALEDEIAKGLPQGYIREKTPDELRGFLDGTRGAAYGIFEESKLQATSLLRLPSPAHPNTQLTPFPRVPREDWPLSAAFLENMVVHPRARGRGYQRLLIDACLKHARAVRMKWVCSGVHLKNQVSWANLLIKGMAIVGIRFDPGYPVIGLLKAINAPELVSDPRCQMIVPAQDADAHNAALTDGYVGARLATDGSVVYQRLPESSPTTSR
jgi:GNAT superfamily N-acetyltransferase